jgi:hypothetical protein
MLGARTSRPHRAGGAKLSRALAQFELIHSRFALSADETSAFPAKRSFLILN